LLAAPCWPFDGWKPLRLTASQFSSARRASFAADARINPTPSDIQPDRALLRREFHHSEGMNRNDYRGNDYLLAGTAADLAR
jgi:hypothetical protein